MVVASKVAPVDKNSDYVVGALGGEKGVETKTKAPDDDEDDGLVDFDAVPTIREIFEDCVRRSAYGRVTAAGLALSIAPVGKVPPGGLRHFAPLYLGSLACIFGQIVTALAVPNAVNFIAQAGDDDQWTSKFAPSGSDDPHYFTKAYKHSLGGLPLVTWITLAFCYMSISGDMLGEIRQIVASMTMRSTALMLEPLAAWRCTFHLAGFLLQLRLAVLAFFAYSLIWLLGRSDGVANIVLNSLALSFILNVDDIYANAMNDRWSKKFHGHPLGTARAVHRLAAVVEGGAKGEGTAAATTTTPGATDDDGGGDPTLRNRMERTVVALYVAISVFLLWPLVLVAQKTSMGKLVGAGSAALMSGNFTNAVTYLMVALYGIFALIQLAFSAANTLHHGAARGAPLSMRKVLRHLLAADIPQVLFLGLVMYGFFVGISRNLLASDLSILAEIGQSNDPPDGPADKSSSGSSAAPMPRPTTPPSVS